MRTHPISFILYIVGFLFLASSAPAQVTNDHGDPGISDANISFMDRGIRPYQDVLPVTPEARGHLTVVNLAYGNLIHQREDLFIPGGGIPLRVAFTYNSGSFFNGRYGYGWQMNYNVRYVTNSLNGSIIIVRPDDRTDLFIEEDGEFTGAYGVMDRLEALETGYKLIVYKDFHNNRGDYTEYYFDSPDHHYVTRLVDRNGNALLLSYNDENQLIAVTGPTGRVIQFTYQNNKLTQVSDPGDRIFTYTYVGDELTAYTDPLGGGFVYTYTDGCHDMTGITDANGNSYQFSWDNNYALSVVTLDNDSLTLAYKFSATGSTTVTDAMGHEWLFQRDALNRITRVTDPLGNSEVRTWSDDYLLTAFSDGDGNQSHFGYDAQGNLILITDALGNNTRMHYDPIYRRITSHENAAGSIRQYAYDESGNLETLTQYTGEVTQYLYNSLGQIEKRTDFLGHETFYLYDEQGNLTGIRNALNGVTGYTHDALGRVTSMTDANGHSKTYEYDALGRITRITNALEGHDDFEYDPAGNITRATGLNGNQIEYEYDGCNRLVQKTGPTGGVTQYEYDALGRLTSVTDPNGQERQYVYDAAGRVTRTVDPLGAQTTYTYNGIGQRTSITDPNGHTTHMEYDPMHRLVQVTDALGGVTAYAYDELGNMTLRTDPDARIQVFEFDPYSRCISKTLPSGNTWLFRYDAMGRMTGQTDPKGVDTEYTYDALGRLIQSTHAEGVVTWAYDAVGNLLEVVNGCSLSETTSHFYDPLNRRVLTHMDYGGFVGDQTIRYAYDAGGNLTTVTYPDGETNRYTYDAANRQTSIQSVDGETGYTYDAAGFLQSITYSNGMEAQYRWDAAGRPQSLKLFDPEGAKTIDRTYTYDPAGNKLTEVHGEDNTGRVLTYDALNRLTEAVYNAGALEEEHLYTYDAGGHRLTKTVNDNETVYSYNADGRVTQEVGPAGATTYLYDNNGNRTRKTTPEMVFDFQYDSQDRLILCTRSAGGSPIIPDRSYQYTATGQRAMVEDHEPVYFTHSGSRVIVEQGASWKILYNPGIALREDDLVAYSVYDHVGTSVVEIWPEGGWHDPFHLVDFDEFGIKRKGSSEILTTFGTSIWDPLAQTIGAYGFDPYTQMVTQMSQQYASSQYSPLGTASLNYNASASYVNSLRDSDPTRYNQLQPMLQQQYENYYQQQQQFGQELMNQAIADRQAELDAQMARDAFTDVNTNHLASMEQGQSYADRMAQADQEFMNAMMGEVDVGGSVAPSARSSSGTNATQYIDNAFTLGGDAVSIMEALGFVPGLGWVMGMGQWIYRDATGTQKTYYPVYTPTICPIGVWDPNPGYSESFEKLLKEKAFNDNGGMI